MPNDLKDGDTSGEHGKPPRPASNTTSITSCALYVGEHIPLILQSDFRHLKGNFRHQKGHSGELVDPGLIRAQHALKKRPKATDFLVT